ncbi:hypothetical protein V865_000124 [Kwoniella europaea PYCC6329]|uniref:Uncharacterized protein n=1 Tax=Kwoniella europaea PYCC6329 TaxID=1423913 RepID=A0AAX4K6Q3_9TREE
MTEQKANVRFLPSSSSSEHRHPTVNNRRRIKRPISPPPLGHKKRPKHSLILHLHHNIANDMNKFDHTKYWNDYYSSPDIGDDEKLPKPPSKIKLYSTKWKLENPNPKSKPPSSHGKQAFYGNPMMMGYGGGGMGMGMYPGMSGMGPMGMGIGYGMGPGMGMMGYGMPRYGGYSMYGGYGGYGMVDPLLGQYGAPPAANFGDDFPDAHRIEHAYRQSAPEAYGMGMGMMGGGMGINNIPGSQVMLYGRGMPYNGWYA